MRVSHLGQTRKVPDDWAGGGRRREGVTRMQAIARNCRNQSPMRREKRKRPKPRGESTNAEHWGGPTRTSEEGSVMGLEQRGRVRRLHERNNWKQDDLDACDKQTVPYREALGVRSVSSDQIQRKGGWSGWSDARAVRGRLVEKSLQALESDEFGYLLSSAGARHPHSEKEWWRKDPGRAHRS